MNRTVRMILPVAAVALLAGCATQTSPNEPPAGPSAVLHFADLGGLRNWRSVENGRAILIEGRRGQWYRATFFSPCTSLPFASTIAFATDTTGDLDKFSSILTRNERCYFRTFERLPDPDEEE
ncbi:DUF6491 family protein [Lentisalinibacter sediminis]|uniref:DUF6491 family protein n=1 Tax=Lentisalinibacter sediminis TaxID=2992237 RepID=UPI003868A12E